ncbi:polyisoprenoid-binding protein, partial [Stenotrophomonas maltophilia]
MSATRKLLLPLALTLAIAACSKPADTAAPAADAAAPATTEQAATPAADAAAAAPAAEAIKIASGTYKLDPTHTDVPAQWSHFGFSNPSPHFGNVEGTLVYNAEDAGPYT